MSWANYITRKVGEFNEPFKFLSVLGSLDEVHRVDLVAQIEIKESKIPVGVNYRVFNHTTGLELCRVDRLKYSKKLLFRYPGIECCFTGEEIKLLSVIEELLTENFTYEVS